MVSLRGGRDVILNRTDKRPAGPLEPCGFLFCLSMKTVSSTLTLRGIGLARELIQKIEERRGLANEQTHVG